MTTSASSALTEQLGIDGSLFAFSHCRDVVREVSRAGGLGVLGVNMFGPDELRRELRVLEQELGGRPYGVDVLYPGPDADAPPASGAAIPSAHRAFLAGLATEMGVPGDWAAAYDDTELARHHVNTTRQHTMELIEVCLEFSPRLLVSALRPLPAHTVEEFRGRGVLVGGMCGTARHARSHVASGADLIIAQGSEAGGHTGDITTMVLVPEVVDAVGPVPVLAAGGIGTGRQMAAALALGAAGVWTGSLWLTTIESDLESEVVDKLLRAGSDATVRTRAFTGKPCRSLADDEFVAAWHRPDAPEFLPMPLQELLIRPLTTRAHALRRVEHMGTPVGQIVGQLRSRRRSADVVYDVLSECDETLRRVAASPV